MGSKVRARATEGRDWMRCERRDKALLPEGLIEGVMRGDDEGA